MIQAMHKRWMPLCRAGVLAGVCLVGGLVRAGDGDQPVAPSDATPAPAPAPDAPRPAVRSPRVPVIGDSVRITFADGRVLEGELLAQDRTIVQMKVGGAVVKIELADGDNLEALDSPADRYKELRASIPDDDIDRLLALSAWLQRQGMYEQALTEVSHVLSLDATNAEALRQKRVLGPLIEIRSRTGDAAPTEEPEPAADLAKRPGPGEFPLLTHDQINLIKLYEVDLKAPPRILVKRETIDKLLTRYSDNPLIPATREGREAFRKLPPAQILDTMFRVQARDLYAEVEVLDNPRSMEFFRDRVQATWLINVMATTRCHGGSQSGRLKLYNRRPAAEESVYTNFLIIDRFQTEDGQHLINYEQPERSLLLQYALNRADASSPHPVVDGWEPAFRSRESRRFKQAVEWINMLYRPRPTYPVTYTPPGEAEAKGAAPEPVLDQPVQTPR